MKKGLLASLTIGLLSLSLLVLVVFAIPAHAMFVDNFDSTAINAWPAGWIKDGNAGNVPNGVQADPIASYVGDNALYLSGQPGWAPLAHHAATFEQNFDIAVSMYFNSSDAHLADGFISLWSSAHWETSGVHIFELQTGKAMVGSAVVKSGISANVWHDIDIQYRRGAGDTYGSVSYYLDDEFLGTWSSSYLSGMIWDLDYHYLTLVANNQAGGQYMYFDDVSVSPLSNNPVPEPTTMLLLGFGLLGIAGVSRRKN